MKQHLYKMLVTSAEADKSKALLSLEILSNNAVGIGDHSTGDFYKNAEEALAMLVDAEEFKKIQQEQYEMFASKHLDYGLSNIALGGDIVNNEGDKKFSLTGLAIRLTDKISRLRNLMVNGKNYVEGEGMEDTFIDISNYGIIGLLVGRNKWKK